MPKHLTVAVAGETELATTSESEEMYLITVARVVEEGRAEPVPMPVIAEALGVSVASANEMVRKLATRGLLGYEPYRGAGLTDAGRAVAARVLRTRRLWTTFLATHLGFAPVEADDQACHLEHVTDPAAADRLAAFLGDPATDPLGRPIPAAGAPAAPGGSAITLDQVTAGTEVEIVAVRAARTIHDFLVGERLVVGARIVVLATGGTGVLVDAGHPVHLSPATAASVDVRPIP